MAPKRTYLERYQAGEYEQVWDDLLVLGEASDLRSPAPPALALCALL